LEDLRRDRKWLAKVSTAIVDYGKMRIRVKIPLPVKEIVSKCLRQNNYYAKCERLANAKNSWINGSSQVYENLETS
jgi:hypothetical protein